MTSSAEWAGIDDQAGVLAVRVGGWNHFGYASPEPGQAGIPPLGERSAEAIRASRGAIDMIDEIVRNLYDLRAQLIDERRTDSEVRMERVEQLLEERQAQRVGGGHVDG